MGKQKIEALKRADFGLAAHRVQHFDAMVSNKLTKTDLEAPSLWELVAGQIKAGAEIRAVADDYSFVARLFVTFAQGSSVRAKVIDFVKMETVDHGINDTLDGYDIKMRGPKKWCVVKTDTGEVVREMIPTQELALKELAEHRRALAA